METKGDQSTAADQYSENIKKSGSTNSKPHDNVCIDKARLDALYLLHVISAGFACETNFYRLFC